MGKNPESVRAVIKVLLKYPKKGVWLRKIARDSELGYGTVHYILNNSLRGKVVVAETVQDKNSMKPALIRYKLNKEFLKQFVAVRRARKK